MYPNFFLKNLILLKMNYGPFMPRFRAIRGLSTGVRAILLIKLRNPWKWGFLKRILRRNEAENGHAYEAKYRSREVKEFIGAFNSHRKMYPYFYLILGISPQSGAGRRLILTVHLTLNWLHYKHTFYLLTIKNCIVFPLHYDIILWSVEWSAVAFKKVEHFISLNFCSKKAK